jgi:sulfur relay (sulfurtransferase) DsrF/TusC family protein
VSDDLAGTPAPPEPIVVLVSTDPETSHRANEAVRIALGILAGENEVVVVLLGAGAKVLDADVEEYVDGEDLLKHLTTLKKLGQAFHVERSALRDGPGWNPLGLQTVPLDRPALAGLLARSRRVLVF